MKRPLMGVVACIALVQLAKCHRPSDSEQVRTAPSVEAFTILAGSELTDVEARFKVDIRSATGLEVAFSYAGTLEAVDRLAAGQNFDALWVSHGKYIAMNPAMKGRIVAQEKTMLSPVILGLKASKARQLGWDAEEPTWKDIAAAAKAGRFTFGMTNPASSNTGFTATIGLAAALASNPDNLTAADVANPEIADFLQGQSLSSGSSGWLAEAYQRDQGRVDGIINYESVLLSLNASGKLAEPLTPVYPKEGIITADYPLMLLNSAKRGNYNKLVGYLRSQDFQTRMSALTLRRPINADAVMSPAIPKRTLVELSFPNQPSLISALLESVLQDLRIPAASRYVLDLSGSMDGERLDSLKQAMLMLASETGQAPDQYAHFRKREEVGIITFSTRPAPTVLISMGSSPDENAAARTTITQLVAPFAASGKTAIYSSVQQAVSELAQERATSKRKRYYTVVLMTDGKNNRGLRRQEFNDWYRAEKEYVEGIPVFPILFGEGDARELRELAELTGGRLFDSRSTPLPTVFREIRAYQ